MVVSAPQLEELCSRHEEDEELETSFVSPCAYAMSCRRMNISFVEGASESRFDLWTVTGGLVFVMALAFVRLLSERPVGVRRKGGIMNSQHRAAQVNIQPHRTYLQYIWETIWTTGAGVMAASLATLSE